MHKEQSFNTMVVSQCNRFIRNDHMHLHGIQAAVWTKTKAICHARLVFFFFACCLGIDTKFARLHKTTSISDVTNLCEVGRILRYFIVYCFVTPDFQISFQGICIEKSIVLTNTPADSLHQTEKEMD